MVCAPVRSIIPELDNLSVHAHKPCSVSHLEVATLTSDQKLVYATIA